ncbi:MAG TPA: 1-acyl-sn-glycerol-3-phosphate acyltransferase [Candidatus Borkfalkia avistercoris]|uniref:1-acyl-sn-glycerol-3-phosphate acyltransferase n=1 Tax=Candidatus Borkfalkia avistercoris TaxID=2838504 RepID=A0A9D2CZC3_9FIRM|nr:1-acyl-sn-glycerol-3-phosphate acyltransferase [Candidatus Borkfalkia avistercoris]
MYKFLKALLNFVTQIIHPYKLIGKGKVKDGACVLVGNHYRLWDIVHMACTTKERVHFITKKELYKNKLLAYLCNKVEAIPVSRDGQDAKAIMTALRYLKKGEKISMFPEGTRNRTDQELLPLKGGAALFAIKAKVPVYPIMTIGKTKYFRRTPIIIGDPIDLSEFYEMKMSAEDYARAEEIVREKMLATMHGYMRAKEEEKAAKKSKRKKAK